MIHPKYIFLALIFSFLVYACGDDNNAGGDPFDHAAQAIIDNDSLISFFNKHYYDTNDSLVKPLISGQTSLSNDPKLKTINVIEQDVDYTLYYYVEREGSDPQVKGNPTVVDSILAKYSGRRIYNTDSLTPIFDANTTWFPLSVPIRGWTYGFIHYKAGEDVSANNPNNPINYLNSGKGVLFIPSGLAYRNIGRGVSIPPNANLMFTINLFDIIVDTDGDLDGIPSIAEDLDGDGDPRNDDTDEDGIPNFLDVDDDNDGKSTKDEDRDGNGDPRNDFNDPENPTLPDYLNPQIFG